MTDFPDRPGYSFNPGPPPEASRFLRNKSLQSSFSWQDVEPEEHANAFAVAKMAGGDLLADAKEVVQKALDEGMTFAQFQKEWKARPGLRDWTAEAIDPETGEVFSIPQSTPRRLRTIYQSNMRSARAAGQWERIERTKRALPYLEYRLGPSEHHRPHHEDKNGLVLPVDDPFWNAWMPPNGWGCKCWVRQLTRRQADRIGVSKAAPQVPTRQFVNARTGEVKQVPAGIDPGWERNPGKLRLDALQKLRDDKLGLLDDNQAQAAMRDYASSWMAQRIAKGEVSASVPVARLPVDIADRLGTGRQVNFNERSAGHVFVEKSDRRIHDLSELGLLSGDGVIWALAHDVSNRPTLHALINAAALAQARDRYLRLPIRVTLFRDGDGWVVTTKHRVDEKKWRRLMAREGAEIMAGGG